MKRTTTRSAVAAATAAVCALAFAPAAPALDARPAERHVVLDGVESAVAETALSLDADGRLDREVLVGALGGLAPDANRLDARAHRDAVRTLLLDAGATPFTPVTCVEECGEPMEPDEEWEPESYEYSFSDVYSADDVDGDGYGDLAEVTFTYGYDVDTDEGYERSDVVLRSGRDGATLWSVQGAPGFFAAVPDVDGDGLPDLMSISGTWDFVQEWSCDGSTCEDTFEIRISRSFEFLRGVDGATLSGATIDSAFGSHWRESSSSTGPVYDDSSSDRYFDENMVTELDFVDTGHGHELLLGTISTQDSYDQRRRGVDAFVTSPNVRDMERSSSNESTVSVISPVSGAERVLLDSADDGRISIPRVFHGAGAGAVLVERFDVDELEASSTCLQAVVRPCPISESTGGAEGTAPSVALVDLDGTTRWETELAYGSFGAVPAGGDVDGDGLADVLDLAYDEESGDDVVVLRSGADGSEVWASPFVYGQATDTGLVGLAVSYRENGYDLDAVTVDGATGAILARVPVASQTYDEREEEGDTFIETYSYVDFLPLVDGDVDLLVEHAVVEYTLVEEECFTEVDEYSGEEYEYCWAYYEGRLIDGEVAGRDGRDLATLFAYDLERDYLAAVVDVDGDLDVELYVVHADDADGSWTGTLRRLDDTVLWTGAEDSYLRGPVAVPGGADLLSMRFVEDETAATLTEVHELLDGRTGAVRFELARQVYDLAEPGEGQVVVTMGFTRAG